MMSRQDVQKRQAWEVRLRQYRTSGMTVARFCEQEGVPVHRFYYWSKRIGSDSGTRSLSRSANVSKPRRKSVSNQLSDRSTSETAMVRFRWNERVEVSVPADCLGAIQCLAECLRDPARDYSNAFQEVVVTS
jgi:hypothetical protein